jgi:superfamily II DNA/RNA helicase
MTQLMDIMTLYFEYRGFKFLRLDGTTKVEDRDKQMQMFNAENSEYYIFLLSTRAGGLGLNLQTADTVIIYDSDWNPMMDLQAQDRAHRIGQKKEVRVYRLMTNTVLEEAILTKAAHKKEVDAKVIQAGLFNNKSTDIERREKLRDLFKNDEDDEDNNENEFLTDQQLNEIIARDEKELIQFELMDKERKVHENFTTRLMENEIPSWLMVKETEIKEEEIDYFGRGFRRRNKISYIDAEPEWNIDGSFKRVQKDEGKLKKYSKIGESSEDGSERKAIVKDSESEVESGELLSEMEDDAIYDPTND